jgi:hypothetical protein
MHANMRWVATFTMRNAKVIGGAMVPALTARLPFVPFTNLAPVKI